MLNGYREGKDSGKEEREDGDEFGEMHDEVEVLQWDNLVGLLERFREGTEGDSVKCWQRSDVIYVPN